MKAFIPYQFGVSAQPLKPYDRNETKAKRLEKLLRRADATLITEVCKHYITHFIPQPIEQENTYWIASCFPTTDRSPVRVSIWFPEVFNIHLPGHYYNHSDQLACMVFTHQDYLDRQAKRQIKQQTPGLILHPEYFFKTGIKGQLAAFMPLSSYFDFVKDERIYEGIRAHNYELMLKGRTPFKKGHNYEFVRYLLGHS